MDFDWDSLAEWLAAGDTPTAGLGVTRSQPRNIRYQQSQQQPILQRVDRPWECRRPSEDIPQQQTTHSYSLQSTAATKSEEHGQYQKYAVSWPPAHGITQSPQAWDGGVEQLYRSPNRSPSNSDVSLLGQSPPPHATSIVSEALSMLHRNEDDMDQLDIESLVTLTGFPSYDQPPEEQHIFPTALTVPDIQDDLTENVLFPLELDSTDGNNADLAFPSSSTFEPYPKPPTLPVWINNQQPSAQGSWQWANCSTLTLPITNPTINVTRQPPEVRTCTTS